MPHAAPCVMSCGCATIAKPGGSANASKKEPHDPNGASTSANAEQNRSYRQLSGEAKHSKSTPNRRRSTPKALALSAAWKPSPPSFPFFYNRC